ncbi:hypothetical protein [Clostridium sp.]|uniref:hypothetical protein n=1 Tax=Clostridium sp. TaxID=1506 RepID=UPI003F4BF747
MRKCANTFIVFLMALTVFTGIGTRAEATANKDINVKVEVGFNKNYKVGNSSPITMNIDNKYKDIKGEVEIRVPSTPGKYVSYVKQLSMQKNSQKDIIINVPISGARTDYTIVISNGKEIVYEDKLTINNTSNNMTQFIGILSEDSDSLTYINEAPSNIGTSLVTKTIMLNEKSFPEDFLVLKTFDVLIINNYDTTRLSKAQYEVLKQWVKNGGTLMIGTGVNQAKTLGVFKDDFIKGSIGEVSTITTSKINNVATYGDNNSKVSIEALDMKIENSKVNMAENGVSLVQSLSVGKGVIGIVAFDLGLPPFVGWSNNSVFAQKLIGIINPDLGKVNKGKDMQSGQDVWVIRNIMNQFSELASAKTGKFYIIIFIYILVVAPLSYIILKKLDKREFMWISVPVLAVIFGFIVFISGSGGRINKVTANVVSGIYMDEKGNAGVSTYAGIFTTNKMKLTVQSKAGKQMFPMVDYNNQYGNNMVTGNEELEAKIYVDGNRGLEYVNTSILENKVMRIQQQNLELGKIETDVKMKNGSITGNIKNSTKIDLEDCYIVTTGEYYKIGNLKIGESKVIPTSGGSYGGNMDQFSNQVIMGYNQNGNQGNTAQVNSNELIDNSQKQGMLRLMFRGNNMEASGIKLIGFSKTPIEDPILINGENNVAKNERIVLVMPISVRFIDGNNVNYPMGFIPFEVVSSNSIKYDTFNKRLYGIGDAEIEYSIDKKVNVEEVAINTTNLTNGNPQQPNIYIYNYTNDKYEKLIDTAITGDKLKRYLNEDNKIKIKLEIKNDGDYGIPKISASGKVK